MGETFSPYKKSITYQLLSGYDIFLMLMINTPYTYQGRCTVKKSLLTSSIVLSLSITSGHAIAEEYGDYAKETMYTLVDKHAGRIAGTNKEVLAGEYMTERMSIAGSQYQPSKQDFSFVARRGTLAGQNIQSSNIIVSQAGHGSSQKTLYVGAHYDSAPTDRRTDRSTLEGLDDNASGAGVLTELVYQLSKLNPEHNIKFIAFGAEEYGLHGSKAFVDSLSDEEKQNAIGMINLDSLLTGDFMYVNAGDKAYDLNNKQVVAEYSKLRDDALAVAKDLGLELKVNQGDKNYPNTDAPYKPYGVGCCSDQESFDSAGIPVAGFEATNWDIGEFDGYTQTTNPKMSEGNTWHEPDEDNRAFLTDALGEEHINQRMKDFSKLVSQLIIQTTNADLAHYAQNLSRSQHNTLSYLNHRGQLKHNQHIERTRYLATQSDKKSGVWFDAHQSYQDNDNDRGHQSQLAFYGEHAFKPNWVVGAGLYGGVYLSDNQSNIKRDVSYGGQLYSILTHPDSAWWNTTVLDYTKHDLQTRPDVQSNTSLPLLRQQSSSDIDANVFTASSEIGYHFINQSPLKHGLYAGATYQHTEFDEYLTGTENTRTAFKVHENSYDALYANVGYQLQHTLNIANYPTTFNARLGYTHVINQDDITFKATSLADNNVREITTAQEKDHYGHVKLGIGSHLSEGLWLYGNVESTFAKNTDNPYHLQMGVQYQF